jgi:hypothetical protein
MTSMAAAKGINQNKVPQEITSKFYSEYPNAEEVKWKKTKDKNYKVGFWVEDHYTTVIYDGTGKFLESIVILDYMCLPESVKNGISNFGDYKVSQAIMVINSSNRGLYKVDLVRNLSYYQLLLDENGNIIG